jgi:hypothetical protein
MMHFWVLAVNLGEVLPMSNDAIVESERVDERSSWVGRACLAGETCNAVLAKQRDPVANIGLEPMRILPLPVR